MAIEAKRFIRKVMPPSLLEDRHEAIAVHRLHDEGTPWPENTPELGEAAHVVLVAVETERREQIEHHIEAVRLEGDFSVVALHPARPVGAFRAAAGLIQE